MFFFTLFIIIRYEDYAESRCQEIAFHPESLKIIMIMIIIIIKKNKDKCTYEMISGYF